MIGIQQRTKDFLLRAALGGLRCSRLYTFLKPYYGGIGHILMLHRVVPAPKVNNYLNADIEITRNELYELIYYFKKRNYNIVSLDEVYDILLNQKRDIKFVSFTFDDGYQEIFNCVYPIFKNMNLPFTLYLATGFPDGTAAMWWYALEKLLLKNDLVAFSLNGKEYSFQCTTPLEKYYTFIKIRNLFLSNYDEKSIDKLFKKYNINVSRITAEISLNWEQVKQMSRNANVTIASHTSYHNCLKYLTTEQIKEDVVGSVERLESQLQKKVHHFSYPFGQKQNGTREFAILKELGFKTATTTRFANIFLEHWEHRCSLPRIYKLGRLPLVKYLDVLCSGSLSALIYRFRKIVAS